MSRRLWVATRKGIFTWERAGDSGWQIAKFSFPGVPSPMILPDPRDGSIYAALDHGHFGSKLHRSMDGGETWTEIAVPAYPPPVPGEEVIDPARNRPISSKLEKIWALEPGHADQPGVLWCGTIPGALFQSWDFGASWNLVRSLWDHPKRREWFGGGADYPGIHSVCVHPRDSKHVTLGISCGGVWQSTDGGTTWDCRATGMRAAYMPPEQQMNPNIQDPHRVVQCRARPECLWAQHHNGIFRTTDSAASWTEVTGVQPSTFGFAVAVHPQDPDTAWFVPGHSDELRLPVDGRVVVTRTRDGGRSFQVLKNGLPQKHAYDLTLRHALDIDGTGDTLAFGSTTGSLWLSASGGDTWECLSTHLPPIYCVRFES